MQIKTVLQESGEVYTWGHSDEGQLGLGDKSDRYPPEEIIALKGKHISLISCGNDHTVALSSISLFPAK